MRTTKCLATLVCIYCLSIIGLQRSLGADDNQLSSSKAALQATVKISELAGRELHIGSGSIVGTDGDRGLLILSAMHVVDRGLNMKAEGLVRVDGPLVNLPGRLDVVARLPRADVILLRLRTTERLPSFVPICPPDLAPSDNITVWAVGCSGGGKPQVITTQIRGTAVHDKGQFWLTRRAPQLGESGGALIDPRTGYLVGVCSGSSEDKGVYTSLSEIHALCDKAGLSSLYQSRTGNLAKPIHPAVRERREINGQR